MTAEQIVIDVMERVLTIEGVAKRLCGRKEIVK